MNRLRTYFDGTRGKRKRVETARGLERSHDDFWGRDQIGSEAVRQATRQLEDVVSLGGEEADVAVSELLVRLLVVVIGCVSLRH